MSAVSEEIRSRDHVRFAIPWVGISYALLAGVSLFLLTQDLGKFVTLDEINFWLRRSELFLNAIQTGDYAETAQSSHPGVTTMWLGSFGILLRNFLLETGLLTDESFTVRLALMRLPVVVVHMLGILLGYRLLRRLLPSAAAVLAAFFWAVDPFIIGYSRLLHVDALAGTFITLSLLAACVFWFRSPNPAMLVLSALCGSLALLSKSPALILLPMVSLIALVAWLQPTAVTPRPIPPRSTQHIPNALSQLMLWGMVLLGGIIALWPALWVDPLRAFNQIRLGVEAEGAEPHMLGNFFLGQPVDTPSWLFYPVALVLHMFPRTMLGIATLLWLWRRTPPQTRHVLATLVAFAVLFIVAMSIFPKKFDRYIEPVFPAINILAAYGLAREAVRISRPFRRLANFLNLRARHLVQIQLAGICALALYSLLWLGDYSISSFNPLLGGLSTGSNTFLVGWGEGLEEAAEWLNQQPDITGVLVVSTSTRPLQPYLRPGAQSITPTDMELPEKAGYVVVYIRDIMRGPPEPPFDLYYERKTPNHVVSINGVEYVWIYQVAPRVEVAKPASFGNDIKLRGFQQIDAFAPGATTNFQLYWETNNQPSADTMLFVHLIGPNNTTYVNLDLPYPTSTWGERRYVTTHLPLSLPADLPPGEYTLTIGMYDPNTLERFPITTTHPIDPAIDGPNALVLTTFSIP